MPATGPLEIVNQALVLYLGKEPLSDFDQVDDPTGQATATIMRLAYPLARDALLVACPWNFAIRRASPALLPDDPSPPHPVYGWSYGYVLPQGGGENVEPLYCLRVLDTNLDPSWDWWGPWPWTSGPWPWP